MNPKIVCKLAGIVIVLIALFATFAWWRIKWNSMQGPLLAPQIPHAAGVTVGAWLNGQFYSSGGGRLSTAQDSTNDTLVKVWNRQGELCATFAGHHRSLANIGLLSASVLASVDRGGGVRLWNWQGPSTDVPICEATVAPSVSASLILRGRILVANGRRLLELTAVGPATAPTLSQREVFTNPTAITALGLLGNEIIVGDAAGNVKLLSGYAGRPPIYSAAAQIDGLAGCRDNSERNWIAMHTSTGVCVLTLQNGRVSKFENLSLPSAQRPTAVEFSRICRLAVGTKEGFVHSFSRSKADDWEVVWRHRYADAPITRLAFEPNNNDLFIGSDSVTPNITLAAIDGSVKRQHSGLRFSSIEKLVFESLPEGQMAVAGGHISGLRIFCADNNTGEISLMKDIIAERHDEIITLAAHPGGRLVASGSRQGLITLWNLDDPSKSESTNIALAGAYVVGLRFNQSGDKLAVTTGHWDPNKETPSKRKLMVYRLSRGTLPAIGALLGETNLTYRAREIQWSQKQEMEYVTVGCQDKPRKFAISSSGLSRVTAEVAPGGMTNDWMLISDKIATTAFKVPLGPYAPTQSVSQLLAGPNVCTAVWPDQTMFVIGGWDGRLELRRLADDSLIAATNIHRRIDQVAITAANEVTTATRDRSTTLDTRLQKFAFNASDKSISPTTEIFLFHDNHWAAYNCSRKQICGASAFGTNLLKFLFLPRAGFLQKRFEPKASSSPLFFGWSIPQLFPVTSSSHPTPWKRWITIPQNVNIAFLICGGLIFILFAVIVYARVASDAARLRGANRTVGHGIVRPIITLGGFSFNDESHLAQIPAQLQLLEVNLKALLHFCGAERPSDRYVFDLKEVIIEAQSLVEDLRELKNMSFEACSDFETKVYACRSDVLVLLENLFRNALQHGQPGTSVRISVTLEHVTGALKTALAAFSLAKKDLGPENRKGDKAQFDIGSPSNSFLSRKVAELQCRWNKIRMKSRRFAEDVNWVKGRPRLQKVTISISNEMKVGELQTDSAVPNFGWGKTIVRYVLRHQLVGRANYAEQDGKQFQATVWFFSKKEPESASGHS